MKKIIALALAALFVFGIASYALAADLEFSGDMRVRGISQDNTIAFTSADSNNSRWDQRLRIGATAEAGDWKVVTRMTVSEGIWGQNATYGTVDLDDDDLAYITGPIGDGTLTIGRQHANWGNKFKGWMAGTDRIKYTMALGDGTFGVLTDKKDENSGAVDDEDYDDYGVLYIGKMDDMSFGIIGIQYMNNDPAVDATGTWIDAFFKGPMGDMSLEGEFSYQSGDLFKDAADNSPMGFYAKAGMDMDSFKAGLLFAYASNGYTSSKYFNPTLALGTSQATAIAEFNAPADESAMSIVASADFGGDDMSYGVKVAMHDGVSVADGSMMEIDGTFKYNLGDGVTWEAGLAYVSPSDMSADDEAAMLFAHTLQVTF